MKKLVIDGNNFTNLQEFMKEIYAQMGASGESNFGLAWLDDVLYGGIIFFDSNEQIKFVWKNAPKSKYNLNKDRVAANELSKETLDQYGGLYEYTTSMIRWHKNITLHLE